MAEHPPGEQTAHGNLNAMVQGSGSASVHYTDQSNQRVNTQVNVGGDATVIIAPGFDTVEKIASEFSLHTRRARRRIQLAIPGISAAIPREEVSRVEDQLRQGKSVVVSGEAGSGKSGIAAVLADNALNDRKCVLLLDARTVAHITTEVELRAVLYLSGAISAAAERVSRSGNGCRFIIDQLDSCIGRPSAMVLVDLAQDTHETGEVEVVVVSRSNEAHEANILADVVKSGFAELTSHALSETDVTWVLEQLGITDRSNDLITLGRNMLNLALIGAIKLAQPNYDFSTIMSEVDLWEQYLQALEEREAVGPYIGQAELIAVEAARLARDGLNSADRTVMLATPLSHEQQRLLSWQVLLRNYGRICRFRHDQLQEYLYARTAAARGDMPSDVLRDLDRFRTRGVCQWMDKIYARDHAELHRRFMEELFNVGL